MFANFWQSYILILTQQKALVAEFGFGAQNPESRRAQPKVVWTDKVRGGSNPS